MPGTRLKRAIVALRYGFGSALLRVRSILARLGRRLKPPDGDDESTRGQLIIEPTPDDVDRFGRSDLPAYEQAKLQKQTRKEQLEEYKFLRTEIEAIWSQTYTTLNFLLAFIGLVVAAVFSKDINAFDRVAVLLGVSIMTLAGYFIIPVHTVRVWRITTYMRHALEPRLHGIAWETRLAARDAALRKTNIKNPIDRSLFDGHRLILDMVNVMLCLLIVWVLYFKMPWCILGFIPVCIAFLAHIKYDIKRGGALERKQFRDWLVPSIKTGEPVYKTPPDQDDSGRLS